MTRGALRILVCLALTSCRDKGQLPNTRAPAAPPPAATAAATQPPDSSTVTAAAPSPWSGSAPETTAFHSGLPYDPAKLPQCRRAAPSITDDSIGPFHLDQTLAELRQECPQLFFGWGRDIDGYPVATTAVRLGAAVVTAQWSDTVDSGRAYGVQVLSPSSRTAAGVGVGSTLQELERAYGTPEASESDCTLRVWFATRPGLAFRMRWRSGLPQYCATLSKMALASELRVDAVILSPK